MPRHCNQIQLPDGGTAMLCGSVKLQACAFCRGIADRLCDSPRGRTTCSKPLCTACAIGIGPDVDFCPDHPLPAAQLSIDFPHHL